MAKDTAVFIVNSILKVVFALQTSYLHPDEFFQSFQPIYHDNVPWEFQGSQPCRSAVPLYLFYYPIVRFAAHAGFKPQAAYFFVKLQFAFLTWLAHTYCLPRLVTTRGEAFKTSVYATMSWVTMIYQSHTFSNSIETILVLCAVLIVNNARHNRVSNKSLAVLGPLVALGIFNRITFPAWLFAPSIFLVKFAVQHPARALIPIATFVVSCYTFAALDTHFYGLDVNAGLAGLTKTIDLGLVWTPINNLIYNSDEANLAKHGLHPYWTHILVNYPQILGPLLFMLPPFMNQYANTTPFLSYSVGMLVLSLFPHQELRFLIPLQPLAAACVSMRGSRSVVILSHKLTMLYGLIMCIFMGCLHQAGVVPALDYLYDKQPATLLFWRTYKPPTWMLDDYDNSVPRAYFNRDTDNLLDVDYSLHQNYTVDFMGMDTEDFLKVLSKINETSNDILLVAPFNAMLNINHTDPLWSTRWHLDMDHFEPDKHGIKTFTPGLGVYRLLL